MPPPGASAPASDAEAGERVGQVVQHAAAIDVVEGAQAAFGQIEQRAFDEADVVSFRAAARASATRRAAAVRSSHTTSPGRFAQARCCASMIAPSPVPPPAKRARSGAEAGRRAPKI